MTVGGLRVEREPEWVPRVVFLFPGRDRADRRHGRDQPDVRVVGREHRLDVPDIREHSVVHD